MPGNHVDRLPALGDDAVHHLPGRQLLAQQADGHLRDGRGVGGVDSQMRGDRGVRFLAAVLHADFRQRQRPGPGDIRGPRVHHHRQRHVVERPGLQHQRLTAPGLFGRSAQQRNRQTEVVGHLRQRQRGAHRRSRDDVVAAGMPDLGKRIVFGADPRHQRAVAEVRPECRVQSAGGRSDRETALGDQRLRLGAAAMFGERQLRLCVDGVGEFDQVAAAASHQRLHAVGGGECGHLGSISSTGSGSLASRHRVAWRRRAACDSVSARDG